MIFVILGTQDKTFERLLEEIDRQIEKGNINKKVVVQAGKTKYESKNMKIYDLMDMEKFNEYIKKSDYIITHGGVGTILDAIKNDKKVIAVPRLKEYREHENNHQQQIISEFNNKGYILGCKDLSELESKIKIIDKFKPKKYVGDNKKMINMLNKYIEDVPTNKRFEVLSYLFFGALTTLLNVGVYYVVATIFNINYIISNIIAWIICVIFAYLTNKKYVFDVNKSSIKMFIKFTFARIATLLIETLLLVLFVKFLLINDLVSKVIVTIIVIILNYFFSKVCVFN